MSPAGRSTIVNPNSVAMETIPDHKLCGFIRIVLAAAVDGVPNSIPLNTPCHIFGGQGHDVVGFKSSDGLVFSLINPNASSTLVTTSGSESTPPPPPGNGNGIGKTATPTVPLSSSRKRLSRIGLVNGSLSVVHQLHSLVVHKCLRIAARVVRVVVAGCREIRVVVLVDVYLPIALLSGWQFPRSRSTAASLFRHLSCDWDARSSTLECGEADHVQSDDIWNISDCHVLGCNQHCSAPDASKKKLFELHEIFKSLPSVLKKKDFDSSRVNPADVARTGIWMLSDDVLINILIALGPLDLLRVSSTCRHLRLLTATIMPCMKLKLFPHQQVAVEWMLQRERGSEVMPNPLYVPFVTEDGFCFYVNTISGEVVTGTVPTIKDFRGGMFCDEPGLGKTITTLSLILKTQGTWADAPDGVEIVWCNHNGDQKCGYYELNGKTVNHGCGSLSKKVVGRAGQRGLLSLDKLDLQEDLGSISQKKANVPIDANSTQATCVVQCDRRWSRVRRNLLHEYEEASCYSREKKVRDSSRKRKHSSVGAGQNYLAKQDDLVHLSSPNNNSKRPKKVAMNHSENNETWVQCDACRKWRRLVDVAIADTSTAWFCSMNSDPLHRNCSVSEESWDYRQSLTYLPGFYTKGTSGGREENISFFISVLKDNYSLMKSGTKKALTWLAKLSPDKVSQMETSGLLSCLTATRVGSSGQAHDFHRIFQAFGLIKRVEKGATRWYYPKNLVNLAFDLSALRIALCEPLDSVRLYLSKATLVVVPSNLVDHWKTQIQKHVRSGQLRVYVWTDHKKPSVHNLAWDYDIVITTFSRLSAEWGPRKRSALMQVHWLRLIFDEGHTLGSSVNLTNKLQMSVSLTASSRWLLTGTPTPNTPNSQLSHLHPMLKFLREEAYGQNQNSWDFGILRPFEAEMEEGRARLLQLLHRCMISARKSDLQMIPPCIKKVTFLDFNEEHARSYNELVVTVLRNILMADWKDPSHVESLLNPKQWKFRSSTVRNVRLSCCVAGQIKVTEAGQDIQETMDLLVEGGLDPQSVEYAFIKYNLQYGGSCLRCKEWCRLPVITPCRHLLCLDCVALDSEKCTFPGCGNLYEMQSPETLARPENPNPKWPVPKDLIELQPSYKQDDWHPDWQSTSSSKVSYLVVRLKELQGANRTICSSIEGGDATNIDDLMLPVQKSEPCARSKNGSTRLLEKALIFSQFLEHIHVIEQQLTVAGIKFTGMYSPMHSSNKMKSLAAFQHDAECVALVMDGSAALGLDLSFVTHVFLMEPIWDKSMEEQVISRAHRMGATRPIHVETLAMRGTIEEQMLKFLQNADDCRRLLKEESGKHDREGTRANRTLHDFAECNYLAELSFAHTISDRKEPC